MRNTVSLLVIFLFSTLSILGQEVLFVPNEGQWDGDFTYQMRLKSGALFFEGSAIQFVLKDAVQGEDHKGHHIHEAGLSASEEGLRFHALRLNFLNGQTVNPYGTKPVSYVQNYFLGSDSSTWRSGITPTNSLIYDGIYDGSRLEFHQGGNHLKYDWHLTNTSVFKDIEWTYDGATDISLDPEGFIKVETSVGSFIESIPVAWGWKNGERIHFTVRYKNDHGRLSFESEIDVNTLDSLVIDPQLIFTSFSGSLTDNWGFTATYDDLGRLYGGGISFATGYVSTVGAYQVGYNDPPGPNIGFIPDVTISVFEPSGATLLYATYLGGTKSDHPHSLVVNSNGELIVMGTTGSSNFPTQNPIQSSSAGGAMVQVNGYEFDKPDMFLTRFNQAGSSILSSTYLGGNGTDGLNLGMANNYGDASRGEVLVDDLNNIYLTASTTSTNFPTTNCSTCNIAGGQDAIVMKINPAGTSIIWSNYYGSTSDDAGYSIRESNGSVYLCGGTEGGNLPLTTGAYKATRLGTAEDGYVARFNGATGALIRSTYIGTAAYDQTFLMDIDKLGNIFVFGQTLGNYPISSGAWGTPQYRKQFIHKISPDLSTSMGSTAFGSPQGSLNLVPTAFNIDDCLNILLSGWGGVTNSSFMPTTVDLLPVSTDALQSTTNGSDFYFMVLGKNFTSFKYGSYFGGSSSAEHVDGGTSRFDDRGRIYQAVCAGCGGNDDLPTTPGAFSMLNNSSNCNLGVIKLDFETGIEANAEVDLDFLIDTNCYELTLRLNNNSVNANAYYWDFDQGDTSNIENPTATFPALGTYNVMLVAIDTICDSYDTTFIEIKHDTANFPVTDWTEDYVSCDLFREVKWTENLGDADYFEWNFGDGSTLTTTSRNVNHTYPSFATYSATVIARDSFCDVFATEIFEIVFDNDANTPTVDVTTDSCRYGGVDVFYNNIDSTMIFEWDFSGFADTGMIPTFRYPESGLENVTLTIIDTVCNRDYKFDFLAEIVRIDGRVYIPSAFTPNGDIHNEVFKISGNSCLENPLFVIFDSWGNEVFRSDNPFEEFWDGSAYGKKTDQDVYTYRFTGGDEIRMGSVTIIR